MDLELAKRIFKLLMRNDLSKKNCHYYINKIGKSSSKSQNKKLQMHFGKKAWIFLINMYLKNKNIFHYLILLSIIFICSYFWNFIELPYTNDKGSIGALTLLKYNHFNDTLRYLLFIGLGILFN